jgi:hypothetical protein
MRGGYNSRMLLYDNPESGNCYKVRLLLAHLGVEYDRQLVDVVDRSNRAELSEEGLRRCRRSEKSLRERPRST